MNYNVFNLLRQGCENRFKSAASPIIPVMLRNPNLAQEMAAKLDARGVYVVPFSFPVVPHGQDRIRTQMSAAHSREELDRGIDAFIAVGKEMEIIR